MITPDDIDHMRKLANVGWPNNDDLMAFCVRKLCDDYESIRADAMLGKMVRVMPDGTLTHRSHLDPKWSLHLYGDRGWANDKNADTPEEALRAVQK